MIGWSRVREYTEEFDNGVAVAWHRVPWVNGCYGKWTDATREKHYKNLCQIDNRIVLAGEHASFIPAWMEGAVLSAQDAAERLHTLIVARAKRPEENSMSYPSILRSLATTGFLLILNTLMLATAAMAADMTTQEPPPFSSGKQFLAQTGQQIYQTSCQGCHMADGKGAYGAGSYPALANNRNLAVSEFLVFVIVNGKSGMPGFRENMSHEQIANVANYVRSSFGNSHGADITTSFVKEFSSR